MGVNIHAQETETKYISSVHTSVSKNLILLLLINLIIVYYLIIIRTDFNHELRYVCYLIN